jgi:hypothetical protein
MLPSSLVHVVEAMSPPLSLASSADCAFHQSTALIARRLGVSRALMTFCSSCLWPINHVIAAQHEKWMVFNE